MARAGTETDRGPKARGRSGGALWASPRSPSICTSAARRPRRTTANTGSYATCCP